MSTHWLDALFAPRSVALVGASEREGALGTVVMRNLVGGGYRGPIVPVNPKYREVQGRTAWPDVRELPEPPDLAVVCTPPATIPPILTELARRGTRGAVVLSAGLDEEQRAAARASGLRVLGPNSVGLLVPGIGLNASFAHADALAGELAFVSQSGAMCTAVLDWARPRGIGFSAFLSLGDSIDVDFGDALDHLGADAGTRAILLYIESIREARKFMSAARAAARNKPVVAIKAGRVAEGERAAASHTGAMAGSDDVYDYALRRAGVLRVGEIDELFGAVETLQRAAPIPGGRLAIVTNGGGPGVMATDSFVAGGGTLALLTDETLAALDAVLPAGWSHGNPVDVIGDADAARYRTALGIVVRDPGVDVVLAMHAPTAMASAVDAARAVVDVRRDARCAILTCWLGEESAAEPRRLFAREGVATYETPGAAVRALLHLVHHRAARELLMRTPPSAPPEVVAGAERARAVVAAALAEGREWLTGPQATAVLEAYGVPIVRALAAADPDEAAERARELGGPVALKLSSPDVVHKSDVGGVALDLVSPDAVREAARAMAERLARLVPAARLEGFVVQEMARRPGSHELIVGAAVDPIFGPFLLFGQGGIAVELYGDRAVALPPLDLALADELVSRTRIARLLRGYRGRPPVALDALHELLVRVSQLVAEVPEIAELDVNPVLADEHGVIAVDARIAVRPAESGATERLAIRPYPRALEEEATLPDGTTLLVRPIRPDDEATHLALFEKLRPEDVRFRFFHLVREMPHGELARYTQIDYDREMAFIALEHGASGWSNELGVVRAIARPDGETAEFAIVVAPDARGRGLGRVLLEKLIAYLRSRGVRTLEGRLLRDNERMLRLAESLGFHVVRDERADAEVEIELAL